MSPHNDCPICMECIESTTKNCVTTECGHCFHTNCLMKSVAHNGFGCPYCRTAMAEEPERDEDTVWSDEDDDDSDSHGGNDYEELFDDDALRGFRFFWNILNGEQHDEYDVVDEEQLEEWIEHVVANENQINTNIPPTNYVAEKLRQQGVTFDQLVKIICFNDHEEYQDNESTERNSNQLFGKIRSIVSNYTPERVTEQIQEETVAPVTSSELELDYTAQPKTHVRIISRVMISD